MERNNPLASKQEITVVLTLLLAGVTACFGYSTYVAAMANSSVSGSGEVSGVVLTVSAVQRTDEAQNTSVTGQAMFHNRQTGSKLTIDVTQVDVQGNVAYVDGEVIKATGDYANCTGLYAAFAVEDNGEGNPGSTNSVDRFTPPTCYNPSKPIKIPLDLQYSEKGNLQVRAE